MKAKLMSGYGSPPVCSNDRYILFDCNSSFTKAFQIVKSGKQWLQNVEILMKSKLMSGYGSPPLCFNDRYILFDCNSSFTKAFQMV